MEGERGLNYVKLIFKKKRIIFGEESFLPQKLRNTCNMNIIKKTKFISLIR